MTTLKSTLKEETRKIVTEVLETYPEKAQKKRAKHLNVYDEGKADCGVKSNIKSIPGVMTTRGCAYAGSKGVVWGPVKDMIHLSHGPVGCGYYSWSGRRNYYVGTTGVDTFVTMQFTSDFQERDVVFGGDKKTGQTLGGSQRTLPLGQRHYHPVRMPRRLDRG
jgi:nitrogenase molybdenum-iron protein alpha chain